MNSDLIKRLRGERYWVDGVEFPDPLSTEAAEALTAAQEENERLIHDIERLSASLSAEVTENEKLRELVEQAFRDGIRYATMCDVVNVDEAWRWSRARAALDGMPR